MEVRRKTDRIMSIKLVVDSEVLNVVSVYAPQGGLSEEIKRLFWEDLDEVVQGISHNEGLLIGGDFNGHIGSRGEGYETVHGGLGYSVRNSGGCLFWTLWWLMNYRLLTHISGKEKST